MENNYLLDLEDEGHMFRTNCPTMQCPFQKTGILNYATEEISKLAAIYIVEQQGFQSLDNLTNSTTWAGQGKNHLNSINNGDSKSKQTNGNQSERSSHNMPSKHRQGAEVWLYSFSNLGTEAGWPAGWPVNTMPQSFYPQERGPVPTD
jgi:hypothetical protein